MVLIFTLDDDNGTRLASRRQSHDRAVGDHIINLADNKLHMLPDSLSFFKNNDMTHVRYTICQNVSNIPHDAVFFAEQVLPDEIMRAAEKIYVFRWNRRYPSMAQDRVNLDGYSKAIIKEFPGYSHQNITLEVYSK